MSEENVFDHIQGVTYHFSKDGLLEDWRKEALRHREEIEKLKKQNKMLKEAVKQKVIATCNACEDYGICPHSYREYDLNNIINELEQWLGSKTPYFRENDYDIGQWNGYVDCINKIKELKGVDKE